MIDDYLSELIHTLKYLPMDRIQSVIRILHRARLEQRSIFLLGNGGSASTASHFAADLSKNTYWPGVPSFRAFSLADNLAMLTAYANDEGYEEVFARQVNGFVSPGDLVMAISASGNSLNVIKAVEVANQLGATTIGFTGFNGGRVGSLVAIHINVPSRIIEQVEDIHLMLEHLICKSLREIFNEMPVMVQSTEMAPSAD